MVITTSFIFYLLRRGRKSRLLGFGQKDKVPTGYSEAQGHMLHYRRRRKYAFRLRWYWDEKVYRLLGERK